MKNNIFVYYKIKIDKAKNINNLIFIYKFYIFYCELIVYL